MSQFKLDIQSAVNTIETTSFDSAENRSAREFLRTQMDDKARDEFDDAVTTLRHSLAALSPEAREAHRGFACSIGEGDTTKFTINLLRIVSEQSGPGFAPSPQWATSYVRSVEYQRTREFLHRHLGNPDEALCPLTDAEMEEQARTIAASCTIKNVDTMMQVEAELRVYRCKYGFLDGSPFSPGSTWETTVLDGCRFRPAGVETKRSTTSG